MANMRLKRKRGSEVAKNLQFLRPRLGAIDGLSAKSGALGCSFMNWEL